MFAEPDFCALKVTQELSGSMLSGTSHSELAQVPVCLLL